MSALAIRKLITADSLAAIRQTIAEGPFVPSRPSSVGEAAGVRCNLLLDPRSDAAARAVELLLAACRAHSSFLAATWIEAMMPPLFTRYEAGMAYGDRVDSAFVGQAPDQLRCDVTVTISLSDGASCEGGELVIDAAGVPSRWKGDAGDCVIYPSDTLHRLEPIMRGTREIAVVWIQSLVRDPAQRRMLFDLKETLDELDCLTPPPAHTETLRRTYFNLIRMWA
jgi:PKHD-type hydroxylase